MKKGEPNTPRASARSISAFRRALVAIGEGVRDLLAVEPEGFGDLQQHGRFGNVAALDEVGAEHRVGEGAGLVRVAVAEPLEGAGGVLGVHRVGRAL
jgi:hypothetical protein